MAILHWLPLVFWIILWVYWFISAFRANKSIRAERAWWLRALGIRVVILIIAIIAIAVGRGGVFASFALGSVSPLGAAVSGSVVLDVIGVILAAAGVAFAIWARVYLGKNWGMPMTLREKPELVTSGPYKFVRHPIYTGFFVAMFGTGLVDGVIWFVILIVFGIYFIYSAMTEEKMMTEQFPNEYPEYKKRTKMIIPFVI